MATKITKHYKTDFTISVKLLKDANGIPYPFIIKLYTKPQEYYIATWDGKNSVNLLKDPGVNDEYAIVMLDKHGLKPGVIYQETTWSIPDPEWDSGKMNKTFSGETGYELVVVKTDIDGVETEIPLDYDMNLIKGDPFEYSDFTPEQITNLQKPAADAARKADTATANADEATEKANTAAEKADTSTANADEATEKANTAAGKADTATANADEATEKANTAAEKADTSTANADEATEKANTAADRTNEVADSMLSNIVAMEIRDDMNLYFTTPDNYDGVSFSINNGNLIATI